jgi:iron complex outermembrane receptor protein
VVVDGVAMGNVNITDIFDINRVEILKGPQGTLFGTSVSAGVINITTNTPDPTKVSTSVNVEYGSGDMGSQYTRRSLRATTNLPLSDNSAIRFSLHSDENEGIYNNPYEGLSSDAPDVGLRIRYLLNVSDDLRVNLIGDYNKAHESGSPSLTYRYAPPGSALANSLSDCGVTASTHNFDFCSQYYDYRSQLDRGFSAQVDWSVGGNTLTSISSYRLGDTASRVDIEELPLAIAEDNFALGTHCFFANCVPIFSILPGGTNQLQTQNRSQFSQEFRLASPQNHQFEWLAGLYYQHYKLNDLEPGSLTANFGGGEFTEDTTFNADVRSTDYAAFGNITYYLSDSTRLIAGARYTHSDVSENKHDPANSGTDETYSLSVSAKKPTWRVGLQQTFTKSTMAYVTVATGYKGPEISDSLAGAQNPSNPTGHVNPMYGVSPELPITAEIGIKQSILDDRLAIDADIFYEKVKDYQGQACAPNGQGTITCVPNNVAQVGTKGLELDIFGRPLPGLTVNLSGILNPATYPRGYNGTDGISLGGQQLNFSSKTKVTLSGEQTIPLTDVYSFVVGADASQVRIHRPRRHYLQCALGDQVFQQLGALCIRS